MTDQLNILEDKLFNNLSQYPLTENVFKSQLLNRVKEESWLENDLILVLIKKNSNINIIEDYLSNIYRYNKTFIEEFSNELSGCEKKYDDSIHDLWAEINALDYLIKNDYKDLKKIPRTKQKTPDFKDVDNNLFEVKNLRTPEEFDSLIMKKIEILELLNPYKYKQKKISLDIPYNKNSIHVLHKVDLKNIDLFVEIIANSVNDGLSNAVHQYKNKDNVLINLKCSIGTSNVFYVFRVPSGQAVCLSDESRTNNLVNPISDKIKNKIQEAIIQMVEYNKTEANMYILLNWQKPSVFSWDDKLQKITEKSMNEYAKTINSKINVVLIANSNE